MDVGAGKGVQEQVASRQRERLVRAARHRGRSGALQSIEDRGGAGWRVGCLSWDNPSDRKLEVVSRGCIWSWGGAIRNTTLHIPG
jgi:hypothetical protein